jgi:hypothetical protein
MNSRFWLNEIVTRKPAPLLFKNDLHKQKAPEKRLYTNTAKFVSKAQCFKKRKELAAVGLPIQ